MLSDTDIENLLGNSLFNFIQENITPVGYDLRVGNEAVIYKNGQPIRHEKDIDSTGHIVINPGEWAAIKTIESLKLPKNIGGILLSRVSLIRRGFLFIPTSIDPGWGYEEESNYGKSLNPQICNTTEQSISLGFNEPFCTLCLFEMKSRSKRQPGRERVRAVEWEEAKQKIVSISVRRERIKDLIMQPYVILPFMGICVFILALLIDRLPIPQEFKTSLQISTGLIAATSALYRILKK
jgi:deoxycytidine triphosphate deaminase